MYNIIITTHIVRFLGGYHMITANEARERKDEFLKKEMKMVEEAIIEAADKGLDYCFVGFHLSPTVECSLKDLGYQVKWSIREHRTSITW